MEDWDMVGYVSSSEPRLKILVHLTKQASTPTNLARIFGWPVSRISSVLKELSGKGLVVCLNPNMRKGKLYRATKKGTEVVKSIHEMTDIGEFHGNE